MKKLACAVGATLFLLGCAYAISPGLARQADKNIPFESLQVDPESYKGKLVILGGVIVQTAREAEGTLIDVSQKPLDAWGKPQRTVKTGGRFLISYSGYLDPLVYAAGREITVAAEIAGVHGKAPGAVGDTYPVVLSKELKLWPKERPPMYRPDYLDPLYDPYASPRQY